MNSIIWAFFAFLVVAITKYLSSLRLRGLREKMQKDQQDANELRGVLNQASEKEDQLITETGVLQAKLTALRNINMNIERSLQKNKTTQPQSEDQ